MGVMNRLNQARIFRIRNYGGVSTRSVSAFSGVQITGADELDKVLREMPDTLREKYLRQANAAIMRYVVKPKIQSAIGGAGKIGKVTGTLDEKQRLKDYAPRKRKDWPVAWKLKLDAPHAKLIEFGTKTRFTEKPHLVPSKTSKTGKYFGRYRGRILPGKFAFMRKALYGSEAQARDAFKKAIRAFIENASTKAKFAKKAIKG